MINIHYYIDGDVTLGTLGFCVSQCAMRTFGKAPQPYTLLHSMQQYSRMRYKRNSIKIALERAQICVLILQYLCRKVKRDIVCGTVIVSLVPYVRHGPVFKKYGMLLKRTATVMPHPQSVRCGCRAILIAEIRQATRCRRTYCPLSARRVAKPVHEHNEMIFTTYY